ncbi:MAG: M15 family metallopeptidase [Clostridiales bacterium]|nr:M15 family metallopeptidase [Clostridiales bacterium]
MRTQNTQYRVKPLKIAIFLAFTATLIFSFYTISFRNDWMFGFKDTFFHKRDSIHLKSLDYHGQDIKSIPLEELLSPSTNITGTTSLFLINKKHKIDDKSLFNLINFRDTSFLLDENVIDDLENLLDDVRQNTGEKVYIMSTYRTAEDQESIYEENPRIAAPVNASEHQTGLALDLYVSKKAQREFIDTDAGKWIHHNGWKHGFIIRYPFLKKHVTGIGYEPWHIRYVGKPHAEIIYKNRWTLEEYVYSLEEDVFYTINGYVISRQCPRNGKLDIPKELDDIELSPDNTGFYIITGKVK